MSIKSRAEVLKFLTSAYNMVKRGDVKVVDDLIKFAKQQFGDLDSGTIEEIKNVFTKGKAAAATETRTKSLIKDDQDKIKELESEEGLSSLMERIQKLTVFLHCLSQDVFMRLKRWNLHRKSLKNVQLFHMATMMTWSIL